MALAGVEVGEGHSVSAANLGVHLMYFAGESVWRQPFGHGIGVEKRAVNPLRLGAKHSVKSNSVGIACCHICFVLLSFTITTNDARTSGHLSKTFFPEEINLHVRFSDVLLRTWPDHTQP